MEDTKRNNLYRKKDWQKAQNLYIDDSRKKRGILELTKRRY